MDSGRGRSGSELRELARLFLKLGFLAFGGPAAHIAMMREEVVTRRKWMEDQEFLDLVGATNLIPGPNSTELAIHLGRVRAGWRGLVVAGACFIVPAALIVLVFAILYARYGSTPEVAGRLLYGIIPVIIAVIAHALWGLSKTAVKGASDRSGWRGGAHTLPARNRGDTVARRRSRRSLTRTGGTAGLGRGAIGRASKPTAGPAAGLRRSGQPVCSLVS